MLKSQNNQQKRHLQLNKLRNRNADTCGKLQGAGVCNLPFGGCKNQHKASLDPNSFTLCKDFAKKMPLK